MQIGPRIRVGGTLGHIGQEIKKQLPSVGGMIGAAALGPLGGLAGSAIDALSSGHKPLDYITHDITKGAQDAGIILGGKALLGAGGLSGGVQALKGLIPSVGGLTGGSGVQGLGDLAKYGLGAAQLVNQANLQNKSDTYATNAFKGAQSAYDAKAPLRAAGQAGLLNAGQGNPFATRAVQPLSLGGAS